MLAARAVSGVDVAEWSRGEAICLMGQPLAGDHLS